MQEQLSLRAKLQKIQERLEAPKGQYNSFGNYHYRSSEDILGGLKPLLVEYSCAVKLDDEIVNIGTRYYVKATASLLDCNVPEVITSVAFAREAEVKKGMDESQITGACSSYARKYALNGLFAIDDSKDADSAPLPVRQVEARPTATAVPIQNTNQPVVAEALNSAPVPEDGMKICKVCGQPHSGKYDKCLKCWKATGGDFKTRTKVISKPNAEPFRS